MSNNAFDEGRAAAKNGAAHRDCPYPYSTPTGVAWGNGWLVEKDPKAFGFLEKQYRPQ